VERIKETSNQVTITSELIEAGASERGGWNRRQILALGIDWPLSNGWKSRAIGTVIDRSAAAQFLSLRGATKRPQKARGSNPVKSELPFLPTTGENEKRVVDSFWRWLKCQPEETRSALSQPLTWMVRKNNERD